MLRVVRQEWVRFGRVAIGMKVVLCLNSVSLVELRPRRCVCLRVSTLVVETMLCRLECLVHSWLIDVVSA